MSAFIAEHRAVRGVEPICRVPPIAPSTDHAPGARRAAPAEAPPRARRDAELGRRIRRVFGDNFGVDGVRKVWRRLGRDGLKVARCTGARLRRGMGLRGVVRGRTKRPTVGDKAAPRPLDRVNRDFGAKRPDALRVADFTSVATWAGVVHGAVVLAAFARRIVGRRGSRGAATGCGLDALEQAVHDRRPVEGGGLIHHSARGVQDVSIYAERLAAAGIEPSVGSIGDSYDDALAETVIGLSKAAVVRRRGPWRSLGAVEWGTRAWVARVNRRRLLEPIGTIPPAEAEERYYATLRDIAPAA